MDTIGKRESQYSLVDKHGKRRIIVLHVAPIEDAAVDEHGYVLAFRDVTEQRKNEMQLALSRKLDSIGKLAAGVAHEINSPLQYIGDNAFFLQQAVSRLTPEVLRISASDRQEINDAIGSIVAGVHSVSQLIQAMRSFTHPGKARKSTADINQSVAGVIIMAKNEWKYNSDLETEYDECLPLVNCRVDEVAQAVLNVVVNAAHACSDAVQKKWVERGRIRVATESCSTGVRITVADNGVGMSPALQDKIFDPFFTTKDVGVGTGQGLAITYDIIVNKHGGSISLDSVEGKGSAVHIFLPQDDAGLKGGVSDEGLASPARE